MSLTMTALLLLAVTVVRGSNEFGLKFLEENKAKEGVITLPSGFQYKVLREGEGDEHPLKDTQCSCHYEGRTAQEFPEGETFDSSYKRGDPTSFAPSQVIKGWTEAMQLMVQGDKWEMYIPSELGYGESGSGANIKGGDVLVFTMEILSIDGPTKAADRGPKAFIEVTSAAEFAAWHAAAEMGGSTSKVVGVFRKIQATMPFKGKLYDAFKGAAKKVKAAGGEVTILTHSSVERKTGKWIPAPIIDEFAGSAKHPTFKANNVYVQSPKTGKFKKCKTNFKDDSVTGDQVKQAILDCTTKKKKSKAKKAPKTEGKEPAAPIKEEL